MLAEHQLETKQSMEDLPRECSNALSLRADSGSQRSALRGVFGRLMPGRSTQCGTAQTVTAPLFNLTNDVNLPTVVAFS